MLTLSYDAAQLLRDRSAEGDFSFVIFRREHLPVDADPRVTAALDRWGQVVIVYAGQYDRILEAGKLLARK